MILARQHRWRTFLFAAFAIDVLCFALVRLLPRPRVEIGAALDVAVTVPALYFMLIVRAGLAPAISVVPLFLLGLLRATWLAPEIASARPAVFAVAEIAIVSVLAIHMRRGLRAAQGSGDVLERIDRAARQLVPSDRVAAILAGELAVFWYAFTWRRAPEIPAGARAFTIHQQSGIALFFGFLAGTSLMEAALVHLVIARWSVAGAWILTAISVYGGVWLTAMARSFSLRPVLVTPEEVIVRAGLLWTVRIPRAAILVEGPSSRCDLRVPMFAEPNAVLRMAEPVIARGLYGMTRRVSTIGLALDDRSARLVL